MRAYAVFARPVRRRCRVRAAMARFLLIHGAMGGAWCWEPVLPGLRAAGHEARAIDLPGQGSDTTPLPEITLYRYADAVCDALDGMDGAGGPVLLTGHSMGGMVITQAAAQRPEKLAGLVYVAAFLPQPGQALIDITKWPEAAGDSVQANIVADGDPPVATMPPRPPPRRCITAARPSRSPGPCRSAARSRSSRSRSRSRSRVTRRRLTACPGPM